MSNTDAAILALAAASAIGYLLADGEKKRIMWLCAMRRCLLRLSDIIRYERRGVSALLRTIELQGTQQEKALTRLLHDCADEMEKSDAPQLIWIYTKISSRLAEYGVLSGEDREAFEQVLEGLGKCGLKEQLSLIEAADERLRRREKMLRHEAGPRMRLIRTLGVCCGAGLFLVLI